MQEQSVSLCLCSPPPPQIPSSRGAVECVKLLVYKTQGFVDPIKG